MQANANPDSQAKASIPRNEDDEGTVSFEHVEGRLKASKIKQVDEIVEKHPDEALTVVRNWLHQEH